MNATLVGPLCALLSSVTWAFGTVAYGALAERHSPFAVNFTRASLALPLFLVTLVVWIAAFGVDATGFRVLDGTRFAWLFVSMIASYAVGDALFLVACRHLGVPVALAVSSCYPLWSALAGWLLKGEAVSATRFLGVVLCVGGVVSAILTAPDARASEAAALKAPARSKISGGLLALLTSLFWALNTYALARGGEGLSFPLANVVRMSIALALIPVVAFLTLRRLPRLLVPKRELLATLPAFLTEGYGGSTLFFYGMTRAPLAVGAPLSSLAPVVAIPFAVLSGREAFSLPRTAAVLTAVAGIILLVA